MEKAQLEAIKKGIDNDYAALDVLHAETEHALQELDTPKAQQKYSEEYRKVEKSRVRHEARVKAEEIEKAVLDRVAAKLQSAESHWSLDNMLRSARFIPEPKKPVRGEFMLPSDLEAVTIAYEAQVSMHAASEFFARSTFREDLEFATDDEFSRSLIRRSIRRTLPGCIWRECWHGLASLRTIAITQKQRSFSGGSMSAWIYRNEAQP